MTRLLIADDHPFIIAGLEAILRGTEFDVVCRVPDGQEALEALPASRADILLLDVSMPGRGGVDVLRILRSRSDNHPVVLLTASLDDNLLLEALQLQVNGIVLKESAQEQLLECLQAVRAGRRWIEQGLMQKALKLTSEGAASTDPLAAVTTRERAVVELVAQGLRNREIATELGMTEGTVKVYLHRIYEKLQVTNRTELALLVKAR
jgi:two-component system nitrate/nitrite response regulator NarP